MRPESTCIQSNVHSRNVLLLFEIPLILTTKMDHMLNTSILGKLYFDRMFARLPYTRAKTGLNYEYLAMSHAPPYGCNVEVCEQILVLTTVYHTVEVQNRLYEDNLIIPSKSTSFSPL